MKRPQSAKQARNYFAPISNDDNGAQDYSRPFLKGGKKMLNVLTASNDISRMLPKRIQQDKERLYCETLQLKSNLNEMQEQNHRLKTKIATLQKEKERLNRTQQPTLGKGKSTNMLSVVNKNDNGIVANLKKIVRETRDQNDELKKEIAKLKRAVRYTKVVEIQLEKQTIYDENKRLARIIQQLQGELQSRIDQDEEIKNLQYEIAVRQKEFKEVTSDNMKYEELLEDTELKFKQVSQKLVIKDKKWQRDIAVEKRKVEQLTRQVDVLKHQVKITQEKMEEEKKKANQAKIARPASSHPHQASSNTNIKSKINKEKEDELNRNKKLKEELQMAKRKLAQSQNKLKVTDNIPFQYSKDQTFELVLTKNEVNQFAKSKEDEYQDDFQNSLQKPKKAVNQLPLEQKIKKAKKSNSTGNLKTKQLKLSQLQAQIKEILTYRMKYNRYTFNQIAQDILNSPTIDLTYEQLMGMLVLEPFFLTDQYAQEFLTFCYAKKAIKNDDLIGAERLISCLRIFIDDFELLEESEEEEMLYKIADFMTKHRSELEKQFQRAGAKNNLLNKQKIVTVLRSFRELSEEEISLVICYISANIQTLRSINFVELLDRFYIQSSKEISRDQLKIHSQEDELSLGQNEDLDEGQLIADDELV